MKIQIQAIIFILAFSCFSSSTTEKLGIDLELGEGKVFQIRSLDEEPVQFSILNHYNGVKLPTKYFDLIKETLKKNNFKCSKKFAYASNIGIYEYLDCPEESNIDFSKIKMNLHFQNSTSFTITEKDLFEMRGTNHHSKFKGVWNLKYFTFGYS